MCLQPTKLYKKNIVDNEAVYKTQNDAAYKILLIIIFKGVSCWRLLPLKENGRKKRKKDCFLRNRWILKSTKHER